MDSLRVGGKIHLGQLGNATSGASQPLPVTVRRSTIFNLSLTDAVALSLGIDHTCALTAGGRVVCWGRNNLGQLGNQSASEFLTVAPTTSPTLDNAVAVGAGDNHACAIVVSGNILCWGANDRGQLGVGFAGDGFDFPVPVSQTNGLTNAVALAAGAQHTCALRADGQVFCWGRNDGGQLGVNFLSNFSPTPVPVTGLPSGQTVALAAGANHSCALLINARVFCTGNNFSGQLGLGITGGLRFTFVEIPGITSAVALNVGGEHSCLNFTTGRVACWGLNGSGQLGINSSGGTRGAPVPVTTGTGLTSVSAVSAGGFHTCALRADGAVFCWGTNVFGQAGNSTGLIGASVLRPSEVPSFRLNIDPAVSLKGKTRVTTVNIIATCEEGKHLHVNVSLTQGSASGRGVGQGKCTGALQSYPVNVPAQGKNTFLTGTAQAEAEAIIRDRGKVVDTQEWTRAVEIVTVP